MSIHFSFKRQVKPSWGIIKTLIGSHSSNHLARALWKNLSNPLASENTIKVTANLITGKPSCLSNGNKFLRETEVADMFHSCWIWIRTISSQMILEVLFRISPSLLYLFPLTTKQPFKRFKRRDGEVSRNFWRFTTRVARLITTHPTTMSASILWTSTICSSAIRILPSK